jgi:hypothetical protein
MRETVMEHITYKREVLDSSAADDYSGRSVIPEGGTQSHRGVGDRHGPSPDPWSKRAS